MIDVTLPIPPSMNRIWRAGISTNKVTKAVFATVSRSAEYRNWIDLAGRELLSLRQAKVTGWYVLHLELPAKMLGDSGNREKALSDLFVSHNLIDDDAKAWKIIIERSHDIAPKRCRVRISQDKNASHWPTLQHRIT